VCFNKTHKSFQDLSKLVSAIRIYDYSRVCDIAALGNSASIVALLIGGVEALGLIANQFSPKSKAWQAVGCLNDNLGRSVL